MSTSAKAQAGGRGTELLGRLGRAVFEMEAVDVVSRPVDQPLPKLKPIPNLEVGDLGETPRWRELLPRRRWKAIEGFLARGDDGIIASIAGEPVGMIWVTRSSHRDPSSGLHIRLAADEAYAFAMEVAQPYRKLGVGAALVDTMISRLQREATISRVYGWIDRRNRKNQALLRIIFGFKQVQTVRRVRLLRVGWQLPGTDEPSFGPVSKAGRHSDGLAVSGAR